MHVCDFLFVLICITRLQSQVFGNQVIFHHEKPSNALLIMEVSGIALYDLQSLQPPNITQHNLQNEIASQIIPCRSFDKVFRFPVCCNPLHIFSNMEAKVKICDTGKNKYKAHNLTQSHL